MLTGHEAYLRDLVASQDEQIRDLKDENRELTDSIVTMLHYIAYLERQQGIQIV